MSKAAMRQPRAAKSRLGEPLVSQPSSPDAPLDFEHRSGDDQGTIKGLAIALGVTIHLSTLLLRGALAPTDDEVQVGEQLAGENVEEVDAAVAKLDAGRTT